MLHKLNNFVVVLMGGRPCFTAGLVCGGTFVRSRSSTLGVDRLFPPPVPTSIALFLLHCYRRVLSKLSDHNQPCA